MEKTCDKCICLHKPKSAECSICCSKDGEDQFVMATRDVLERRALLDELDTQIARLQTIREKLARVTE